MTSKALGHKLMFRRLDKEFSQLTLARRAGISPSVVSLIESGDRSPTMRMLGKICKALDADFDITIYTL